MSFLEKALFGKLVQDKAEQNGVISRRGRGEEEGEGKRHLIGWRGVLFSSLLQQRTHVAPYPKEHRALWGSSEPAPLAALGFHRTGPPPAPSQFCSRASLLFLLNP